MHVSTVPWMQRTRTGVTRTLADILPVLTSNQILPSSEIQASFCIQFGPKLWIQAQIGCRIQAELPKATMNFPCSRRLLTSGRRTLRVMKLYSPFGSTIGHVSWPHDWRFRMYVGLRCFWEVGVRYSFRLLYETRVSTVFQTFPISFSSWPNCWGFDCTAMAAMLLKT